MISNLWTSLKSNLELELILSDVNEKPRHFLNVFFYYMMSCLGFNGPLRQYFSLYRAVSQREGERGEKE